MYKGMWAGRNSDEATGWTIGETFLVCKISILVLKPTQPPVQWFLNSASSRYVFFCFI